MIDDLRGVPFYVLPHLAPGTLKMQDGQIVTDSMHTVRTKIAEWNADNPQRVVNAKMENAIDE